MSPPWMQTVSGRAFPLGGRVARMSERCAIVGGGGPTAADVCLEDVAHALAHLCRFGGHVTAFYSVAQHSVLVSRLVPMELAAAGLLHDAAEAYLGDVILPLKRAVGQTDQAVLLEVLVQTAIAGRWPAYSGTDHPAVKHADVVALMTERRDVLSRPPRAWSLEHETVSPDPSPIVPLLPQQARALFLERAEELGVKP